MAWIASLESSGCHNFKKLDLNRQWLQETCFAFKDTNQLKVKG